MDRMMTQISAVLRDDEIILFALCNDGTLWRRNAAQGEAWVSVKNVPQYEIESGKLASYATSEEA